MKKIVNDILNDHIDIYGYVSCDEYKQVRSSLQKLDQYDNYNEIEDFKTIIVVGLSYPSSSVPHKGSGFGILSKTVYGEDYHKVLMRKCKQIEHKLTKLGISSKSTVDTGTIDERFAGYLANIGFLGKSQFLINEKLGSYFFIGTILIDVEIEKDYKILDTCKDCTKCIDACPSNALDNGYNKNKCISNISQLKKELDDQEISYFKKMIYGCDICQVVCPKNKGINFEHNVEFLPDTKEQISLKKLLGMSNKEYFSLYKDNGSSWKGPLIIKRNAASVIYNQGLYDLKDDLRQSLMKYKDVLWYNKTLEKILRKMEEQDD